MSYEPLTERLAELKAAARVEVSRCNCGGTRSGQCLSRCDNRLAKQIQRKANAALAAPAHEYVAVARKCAALVAECNGNAEYVEATTVDEAADALDALQAAVVR